MNPKNRKLMLKSTLASILLTSTLQAGVLVDFEVGVGSWNANPSGDINYGQNIDLENNLGLSDTNNIYMYADFNHFVPILPNLRIEQQNLKMDGSALSTFKWNNQTVTAGNTTDLDLTQQDFIFYWGIPGINLLSAGILDINFGIDIKKFDGSVTLNDKPTDLDFFLPMGYIAATIDPPFIPAALSASYKTISYDGSSINDMMAKVSIDLPIPIPLIDIKFDVGYKKQSLKISESVSDNITADMKIDGVFFGISAKF